MTILVLVLILLTAAPAQADTIYTYAGDTFRSVSGIYTTEDRITGYFVVADDFVPTPGAGGTPYTSGVPLRPTCRTTSLKRPRHDHG